MAPARHVFRKPNYGMVQVTLASDAGCHGLATTCTHTQLVPRLLTSNQDDMMMLLLCWLLFVNSKTVSRDFTAV